MNRDINGMMTKGQGGGRGGGGGQGGGRGGGGGQGGGRGGGGGQGGGRGGGAGQGGGQGSGQGRNGRMGSGPGGECVCPKCKTTVPHQAGVPCTSVTCPQCGQMMTRKM